MGLAYLVQELENKLCYLEENAGIEKNLFGKSLYHYKCREEEGYVLATSASEATTKVDIEGVEVLKVLSKGDFIELLKKGEIATYLSLF